MRIIKITFLCLTIATITNSASDYKLIQLKTINYVSTSETENVRLEYNKCLLYKK